VLTNDELEELNSIADKAYPYDDAEALGREESVLYWSEPFKRLIDHSRILPYLVELIEPGVWLEEWNVRSAKQGLN